jgi:hypothetical protein
VVEGRFGENAAVRRAVVSFVLLVSACSSQTPPDAGFPCRTMPIREGAFPFAPAGVGTPYTVKVGAILLDCTGEVPTGTVTVRAEVLGPDNHAVDSITDSGFIVADQSMFLELPLVGGAGPTEGGQFVEAVVTFTPPSAGSYHLTAALEPDHGSIQVDIPALPDRRDAGYERFDTAGPCTKVALHQQSVLCQTEDGELVSAGGPGQLPARNFASDQLVWSTTFDPDAGSFLHVGTLDAGALIENLSVDLTTTSTPLTDFQAFLSTAMLASEDKLVIFAGQGVQEFAYSGALDAGAWMYNPFSVPYAAQWFPGLPILASAQFHFTPSFRDDAICSLDLLDGGGSCLPAHALGSDGRWLWTLDGGVVTAWQLQSDGGVLQLSAEVTTPSFDAAIGPAFIDPKLTRPPLEILRLDPTPTLELYAWPRAEVSANLVAQGFVDGRYWQSYDNNTLFILVP